ncbi:MAG: response regulator [bacterium]
MQKKKLKILLIEDDQMLATIYAAKLEQLGYNYKHVSDGETGINEVAKFAPDVVLLDIILPKKDGFAVLKAIKSDKKTQKIVVILLTNLGQEDDIKKGLDLGAANYLTKTNCTPTQIVAEINKILDKSKKDKSKKDKSKKDKSKKKK